MTLKNSNDVGWLTGINYGFNGAPEGVYLVVTSALTFRSGTSLTSPILYTLEEGSIIVKIPTTYEEDVITNEEKTFLNGNKVLYAECALFSSEYESDEQENLEPIMFYRPENVSGTVRVLDYNELEYEVPELHGETLIRGNIAPRVVSAKIDRIQQSVTEGHLAVVLVFTDGTVISKSWRDTIDMASALRFSVEYAERHINDLVLKEVKILRHVEDK